MKKINLFPLGPSLGTQQESLVKITFKSPNQFPPGYYDKPGNGGSHRHPVCREGHCPLSGLSLSRLESLALGKFEEKCRSTKVISPLSWCPGTPKPVILIHDLLRKSMLGKIKHILEEDTTNDSIKIIQSKQQNKNWALWVWVESPGNVLPEIIDLMFKAAIIL